MQTSEEHAPAPIPDATPKTAPDQVGPATKEPADATEAIRIEEAKLEEQRTGQEESDRRLGAIAAVGEDSEHDRSDDGQGLTAPAGVVEATGQDEGRTEPAPTPELSAGPEKTEPSRPEEPQDSQGSQSGSGLDAAKEHGEAEGATSADPAGKGEETTDDASMGRADASTSTSAAPTDVHPTPGGEGAKTDASPGSATSRTLPADDRPTTPSAGTPTVEAEDMLAANEALPAGTPETVKAASAAALAKKFKATSLSLNKKFLSQSGTAEAKAKAAAAANPRSQALGGSPTPAVATGPRLLTGKLTPSNTVQSPGPGPSVSGWAKPGSPSPQPNGAPSGPTGVPTGPKAMMAGGREATLAMMRSRQGGPAWGRLGPANARGNLAADFPTAQEVAMNKKLKAQAIAAATAAREKALQDRAAASAAYNQHLLETLDAFRGTHLDPNASHWDEMEEDDDLFGEVVEFGDGTQYKIAEVETPTSMEEAALAKLEEEALAAPVSKEDRFTDDYDRSRPTADPQPPFLRGRPGGGDKALFNDRLGRFEPYAGKKPPPEPEKPKEVERRQRDEPPHRPAPPRAASRDRAPPPHLAGPAPKAWQPLPHVSRDAPPHQPPAPQPPSQPAKPPTVAAPATAPAPPSAPAKPVPPAPAAKPVEDLEAMTRTEMASAAERARKRREEEEAAREAERQRAKQKALELEAKFKSPATAPEASLRSPPSSRAAPPLSSKSGATAPAGSTADARKPSAPARDFESWRRPPAPAPAVPASKLTEAPARDTRVETQPRQILNRPQPGPEASKPPDAAAPPGLSKPPAAPARKVSESKPVNEPPTRQSPSKAERTAGPSQDAVYPAGPSRGAAPVKATAPIGSERNWRRAVSAAAGQPKPDERQMPPHMHGRDPRSPPQSTSKAPPVPAPEKALSPTAPVQSPTIARPSLQSKKPSARPLETSNFDEVMSRIRGAMAKDAATAKDADADVDDVLPSPVLVESKPTLAKSSVFPPPTVKLPTGKVTPRREVSRAGSSAPSPPLPSSVGKRHQPADLQPKYSPSAPPPHRLPTVARAPPSDFGASRTERPASPKPVWSKYAIKPSTRLRSFRKPSADLEERNSVQPRRAQVFTWDPPLVGVSPRTLSRDDWLLKKKYVGGVVVSLVSLPKHRILRAARPLGLSDRDELLGPLVLQGRKRGVSQPKIQLNSHAKPRTSASKPVKGVVDDREAAAPKDFATTRLADDVVEVAAEDMARQESQESDLTVDSSGQVAKRRPKLPEGSKIGFKSRPPMSEQMTRQSSEQTFMVSSEIGDAPLVPPPAPQLDTAPTPAIPSRSGRLVPPMASVKLDASGTPSYTPDTHRLSGKADPFASANAAALPSLSSSSPWAPSAPLGLSMLDSRSKDVWSRPDDQVTSQAAPTSRNENSLQGIADEFPAAALPSTFSDFKHETGLRRAYDDMARDERTFAALNSAAATATISGAAAAAERQTAEMASFAGSMDPGAGQREYDPYGYGYPSATSAPYHIPPGYQLVPIGQPSSQHSYSAMYPTSSPWPTSTAGQANGYIQRSHAYSPSPAGYAPSPAYSPLGAPGSSYMGAYPASPPPFATAGGGYKPSPPSRLHHPHHPGQRASPSSQPIEYAPAGYGNGSRMLPTSYQSLVGAAANAVGGHHPHHHHHQVGGAAVAGGMDVYAGSFTPFQHVSPGPGQASSLYSPHQPHSVISPGAAGSAASGFSAHLAHAHGGVLGGGGAGGGGMGYGMQQMAPTGYFSAGAGQNGGPTSGVGAGAIGAGRNSSRPPRLTVPGVGAGAGGGAGGQGGQGGQGSVGSPYQVVPSSSFAGVRGPSSSGRH